VKDIIKDYLLLNEDERKKINLGPLKLLNHNLITMGSCKKSCLKCKKCKVKRAKKRSLKSGKTVTKSSSKKSSKKKHKRPWLPYAEYKKIMEFFS
jgi:hypothetical protein